MLRLWCEWDYGQDAFIFLNEEDAKDWLWRTMNNVDGGVLGFKDHEEIFEDGLAGFHPVTIYKLR